MSWMSLAKAAKYACIRKERLMELVDRGYLKTYPSLTTRFYGGGSRLIDTTDIDALIKKGRAPEGAQRRG